jgi:hypothetical protein
MVKSSKAVGDWRSVVAWTAANAYRAQPLDTAFVLVVEFVMPRPKSLPKTKPTPPHTKRPDVDELLRAIFDALSGVVWLDDYTSSKRTRRSATPGPTNSPARTCSSASGGPRSSLLTTCRRSPRHDGR